jgi:superfamily I DNA/RNA helicase
LRNRFPLNSDVNAAEYIERIFADESWIEGTDEEASIAKLDMGLLRQSALLIAENDREEGEDVHDAQDVLRKVAQALRYQIATRGFISTGDSAPLQVTTLWGAKGVTADHVYIIGLCSETLPGVKRDEYPGTVAAYQDEQRRLLYVSITRPKKSLLLSRPKKILFHEALRLGISVESSGGSRWANLKMCPFLEAIIAFLPDAQSGERWTWPEAKGRS